MLTSTGPSVTLGDRLLGGSGGDPLHRAVGATIERIAATSAERAAALRRAFVDDDHDEPVGRNADGDERRRVDLDAHEAFVDALRDGSVAALASEACDDITELAPGGTLLVAIDPLDGSANLAVDAPLGVIFSIRPAVAGRPVDVDDFLTPGSEQLAAGIVLYGPVTVLALTVGAGTDIYALDDADGSFHLVRPNVRTPEGTREFAINASNSRHWTPGMRTYIADLVDGADGPGGADFNMRWYGGLVADAYRILVRGGVFLYPGDDRVGSAHGRLRLVYEVQAIAMLLEQAGGAATDGRRRLLDIPAEHLHARTPLVFGSTDKVARITRRHQLAENAGDRSPLFAVRGLFRDDRASR